MEQEAFQVSIILIGFFLALMTLFVCMDMLFRAYKLLRTWRARRAHDRKFDAEIEARLKTFLYKDWQ